MICVCVHTVYIYIYVCLILERTAQLFNKEHDCCAAARSHDQFAIHH